MITITRKLVRQHQDLIEKIYSLTESLHHNTGKHNFEITSSQIQERRLLTLKVDALQEHIEKRLNSMPVESLSEVTLSYLQKWQQNIDFFIKKIQELDGKILSLLQLEKSGKAKTMHNLFVQIEQDFAQSNHKVS